MEIKIARREFIEKFGFGMAFISFNPSINKQNNGFLEGIPINLALIAELINDKYKGLERIELLWRFALAKTYYTINPNISPTELSNVVETSWGKIANISNLKKELQKSGGAMDKLIPIILKATFADTNIQNAGKILYKVCFKQRKDNYINAIDRINDISLQYSYANVTKAPININMLVEFIKEGSTPNKLGNYYNKILTSKIRVNLTTTPKEIFASYPNFLKFSAYKQVLVQLNSSDDIVYVKLEDVLKLQQQLREWYSKGVALIDSIIKSILENEKDEQLTDEQIKSITDGIDAVAKLLSLVADKKIVENLQKYAKSAFELINKIAAFEDIAKKVGIGAASGGVLGAAISLAMVLVSFLGQDGPSPEEQIMEQINKLSKQINDLGEHLDKRFDRIENLQLEIYKDLVNKLNQIHIENIENREEYLKPFLRELFSIRQKLYRMEYNILNAIRDEGERQIKEPMNKILALQGGIPFLDIVDNTTFFDYENKLYSWLTIFAEDTTSLPPDDRSILPKDIYLELTNNPVLNDLNYIHKLIPEWTNFEKLPNLDIWSYISLGYSEFLRERIPLSKKPFYQNRLTSIITKAQGIQKSLIFPQIDNKVNRNLLFNPCNSAKTQIDNLIKMFFASMAKDEIEINFQIQYYKLQNISSGILPTFLNEYITNQASKIYPNDRKKKDEFIKLISKIDKIFIIADILGIGTLSMTFSENKQQIRCTKTIKPHAPIEVVYFIEQKKTEFQIKYTDKLNTDSSKNSVSLLSELFVKGTCKDEVDVDDEDTSVKGKITLLNKAQISIVAQQIAKLRKDFFSKISENLRRKGSDLSNQVEIVKGRVELADVSMRIFLSQPYIDNDKLSYSINNIRYFLNDIIGTLDNHLSILFDFASKWEFTEIDKIIRGFPNNSFPDFLTSVIAGYLGQSIQNNITDPMVFQQLINDQISRLIGEFNIYFDEFDSGNFDNTPDFINNVVSQLKLTEVLLIQ